MNNIFKIFITIGLLCSTNLLVASGNLPRPETTNPKNKSEQIRDQLFFLLFNLDSIKGSLKVFEILGRAACRSEMNYFRNMNSSVITSIRESHQILTDFKSPVLANTLLVLKLTLQEFDSFFVEFPGESGQDIRPSYPQFNVLMKTQVLIGRIGLLIECIQGAFSVLEEQERYSGAAANFHALTPAPPRAPSPGLLPPG